MPKSNNAFQEDVDPSMVEPGDSVELPEQFPPNDLVEELVVGFNPEEIKFLVYGESGAGKTVFCSSWPNPIYLDIDKGLASVRKRVSRIKVESWSDLQDAYAFLYSGKHPYKTVIVDSLNELQKICMSNVVGSFTTIRRSYDSLPSVSDYGKMLDDFDKFVRAIRALPMHVLFIANVSGQEFENEIIQPQLTGKNTSRNICRMMDVVGYLYKLDSTEPIKPRAMVFDATGYVTKDRSAVLPPVIEDPTYPRLKEFWANIRPEE